LSATAAPLWPFFFSDGAARIFFLSGIYSLH
jgi:hypothetical protein